MELIKPYVVRFGDNINIIAIDPSKQSDPFYRYKTHQLAIQTIGTNKMTKTYFININDVSDDLRIPYDFIPHFFAKNLGVRVFYDNTKPVMEQCYISGKHDCLKLSQLLIQLIRGIILCSDCNIPELKYFQIKERIKIKCQSCGWRSDISNIQTNDKFIRYISTTKYNNKYIISRKKNKINGAKNRTIKTNHNKKYNSGNKEYENEWLLDCSEEACSERLKLMVPDNIKN